MLSQSTSEYLISVIIPTYNSAGTLSKCLQSVTEQDFGDKQLVIIDGQSTDDTLVIIEEHARIYPFIKFLSEPDNGVYDAMNKGITLADGQWLLFLGADDELFDAKILTRVAAYLATSTAGLVYGNAQLVGDASWARDGAVYDGPFSLKKLFQKNICHQAIFYRKSIFGQIGYYNPRYIVCADWEFNFRCFAKTEVAYIDEIISRFAGGGLSSLVTVDDFNREGIFLLKDYFRIGFFNTLFDPYHWVFYSYALESFRAGKWGLAFYFFALALYHAPSKKEVITVTAGKIKNRLSGRRPVISNKENERRQ